MLSFASPCLLPLVPPYLCYLAGLTVAQLGNTGHLQAAVAQRLFMAALAFVCGFAWMFVLLGASASLIGSWLAAYADQLAPLAGLVVIAFGLHVLNLLHLPPLLREARLTLDRLFGLLGAFVVGTAFALSWTPCVGPVLATILLIAGSQDSAWKGALLLAVYAAGLAIPFLATALAMRRAVAALACLRQYLLWAQKLTGALLVLTGISFMTGAIHQLGFWLVTLFPALSRIG